MALCLGAGEAPAPGLIRLPLRGSTPWGHQLSDVIHARPLGPTRPSGRLSDDLLECGSPICGAIPVRHRVQERVLPTPCGLKERVALLGCHRRLGLPSWKGGLASGRVQSPRCHLTATALQTGTACKPPNRQCDAMARHFEDGHACRTRSMVSRLRNSCRSLFAEMAVLCP